MDPDDIKHFLVTLDPVAEKTTVEEFGTDYEAALAAYEEAERAAGLCSTLDIVLLGADSLETIQQTHSSYFGGETTVEELLPG